MNFVGIFFQLLIAGMFYKRGLCTPLHDFIIDYTIKFSVLEVYEELDGTSLGDFEWAHLHKYNLVDQFFLQDPSNASLFENICENELISLTQFEFISMYRSRMVLLFIRSKDRVYLMCEFSNENDIPIFFNTINPRKPKDDTIKIRKVARYSFSDGSNSTLELDPLAEQAELSVRDITDSIGIDTKIFYITQTPNTNGKVRVEAKLIFISRRFSFSASTHNGNTIVLCVTDLPNERFLIRFSDGENLIAFRFKHVQGFESGQNCSFPHFSSGTINYLNDDE